MKNLFQDFLKDFLKNLLKNLLKGFHENHPKDFLKNLFRSPLIIFTLLFMLLCMISCESQGHHQSKPTHHQTTTTSSQKDKSVRLPYPHTWIHQVVPHPYKLCKHLVYKNGCQELRVGQMTFDIQVNQNGRVQHIKQIKSTIQTDPDQVQQCFIRQVEKLTFPPPKRHENHFVITLNLSSRC